MYDPGDNSCQYCDWPRYQHDIIIFSLNCGHIVYFHSNRSPHLPPIYFIVDSMVTFRKKNIKLCVKSGSIGGRVGGPWPLLNFKTLHRNSFLAIEDHFSLAE